MQSLPTEAKPLTACSQCGTALPPPTGSATFVYGVGPVGYQSCNTCGAKWRYLWQDPPGAGGGLNRLPFLLVGTAIVVLLALRCRRAAALAHVVLPQGRVRGHDDAEDGARRPPPVAPARPRPAPTF